MESKIEKNLRKRFGNELNKSDFAAAVDFVFSLCEENLGTISAEERTAVGGEDILHARVSEACSFLPFEQLEDWIKSRAKSPRCKFGALHVELEIELWSLICSRVQKEFAHLLAQQQRTRKKALKSWKIMPRLSFHNCDSFRSGGAPKGAAAVMCDQHNFSF